MNISEKEERLIHLSKLNMLAHPNAARRYFYTGKLPNLDNFYDIEKIKKIVKYVEDHPNPLLEKAKYILRGEDNEK